MEEADSFQRDPVIKRAREQSNFRAIKNLIQAENSIRVAHNRIRALQAIDERNAHRLQNQVGLIQRIQQVREATSIHQQTLDSTKQQQLQQAQEAHNRQQQMIGQQKEKLREVMEGVQRSRKWQYLSTEEQSQVAERLISESKRSTHEEKAKLREQIALEEEVAKRSLVRFHQGKQSRIKQAKVGEVAAIKAQEAAKAKQLRDLSNVQMRLVEKQSQSQAAYLQVKQRLDSLLTNVKLQNSLSKQSLQTSVHLQGRQNRLQG